MAEVKRRQRERLHNSTKRRSTATCSIQDKDMEGVALESVLQRFVSTRGSRRRTGTSSPTRANVPKIAIKESSPREEPAAVNASLVMEAQNNKHNLAKQQTECRPVKEVQPPPPDKEVKRKSILKEEEEPLVVKTEAPRTPKQKRETPSRKSSSISSPERRKSAKGEEEEEGQTEEEAQKMREVSRKVLQYQSSRSSASSGDYGLYFPPRTILSPRFIPRKTPTGLNRRHSLTILPKSDSDEDDLWMLPKVHTPHLGAVGKMKSLDGDMLLSKLEEAHNGDTSSSPTDGSSKQRGLFVRPSDLANHASPTAHCDTSQKENSPGRRTSVNGEADAKNEGKTLEKAPSIQSGSIFQRRQNSRPTKAKPEEKAKPEKEETSSIMSFFWHLTKKIRPNTEMDNRGTEC